MLVAQVQNRGVKRLRGLLSHRREQVLLLLDHMALQFLFHPLEYDGKPCGYLWMVAVHRFDLARQGDEFRQRTTMCVMIAALDMVDEPSAIHFHCRTWRVGVECCKRLFDRPNIETALLRRLGKHEVTVATEV